MRRLFILAIGIMFGTDAALASTIDCNISEKQRHAIHELICGGPYGKKGCFAARFSARYRKYAHENSYLRECGYAETAYQREEAILAYAKRLEPLGQCIGEQADLQAIWAGKKAEAALDDASCTSARRAEVESQLPEIRKFIAALRDPEPATIRVYQNLGVLKK